MMWSHARPNKSFLLIAFSIIFSHSVICKIMKIIESLSHQCVYTASAEMLIDPTRSQIRIICDM